MAKQDTESAKVTDIDSTTVSAGAGEYFQRDGQEDPPDGGGRDHCPGGKGPL